MTERNTKQKKLILEAVRSREDHPTADEIYSDVHALDGRISRGTVYRNLHAMASNGEIMSVDLVPYAGRYDRKTQPHHHVICEVCGSVCDAPLEYESFRDKELEELTGFKVRKHEVIFRGVCAKCLAEIERGKEKGGKS